MRRMLPKVLDIIKKYRTNDPNELAERLGIKVKYADMMGGPNGIFIKFVKKQVILINKELDFDHQNVVLAHELGHILLHQGGYHLFSMHTLKKDTMEQKEFEANKFAFLLIAHTCLRNNPDMIDGIRNEKRLTIDETVNLVKEFQKAQCFTCQGG